VGEREKEIDTDVGAGTAVAEPGETSAGPAPAAAGGTVAFASLDPVMPDPKASGKLPAGRHGLPPELVVEVQRQRILAAMVAAVGEKGYDDAVVQDVLDRASISRLTFYKHFKGKRECFLAAFELAIERLRRRLTGAARTGGDVPRDRLRAGLAELLRFVENEARTARALLVEVNAAGLEALARRDAAMRRFAGYVDGLREEPGAASPPPITSESIVGGIVSLLHSRLTSDRPTDYSELLPQLMHFAVLPYLGPKTADAELAS